MGSPLLLVSATEREAAPLRQALQGATAPCRWGNASRSRVGEAELVLVALGVGKANTAAGLALAIERWHPTAVVQFGVGGAFVGSFLSNGMVALASEDVHVDCGAGDAAGWRGMESLGLPLLAGPPPRFNAMPTNARLSERLAASTGAPLLRFATSERVTASLEEAERLQRRFDVAIESMEGAAAAQVCLALGVPFAELRAVSNVVGERDRRAWDLPGAIRAVNAAMHTALEAWQQPS